MNTGKYLGKSDLHLSWLPEDQKFSHCDSTLEVQKHADGKMYVVTLDWSHEGAPQIGGFVIVVDPESGAAQSGWTDTWHMTGAILHSRGIAGADSISVTGQYGDAESGIWNWRTEFIWSAAEIEMIMTNISPDGDEEWAVKALYQVT